MSALRSVLLLCWRDTGHPQGGGSEAYLQRIGAQLAASGIAVTLRTARYPGAPRREVVDGVRINRAGGRYSVYVWALLAIASARLGIGPLRGVLPDVVVDTQNGLPFLARLIYGRRVVLLVHHCHREQWPVAGRLVIGFGELSDNGVRARGLTFAVAPAARVVAPAAGRIVFARPFRGFGTVVIIDHGQGWVTLLAGLGRLSVTREQPVAAGALIGTAGAGDPPQVTVELRRRGRPVDLTMLI